MAGGGAPEVHGILKGFDQLVNLVLDESTEFLRGKRPKWPAPALVM